ncbi:unnamed protein product [Acanthoscelides obtectus]|uniref:CHK kinase-like domain-containing protein n=1 Tax=Acanthoscelides obtectus TaxID=200917 RepID=A0A9P0PJX1_ACAOB|nr:unnamed protein product [Acanthoscelides obtectus]CAK1630588.1 hypothetical protein AOBTE_LOCUS6426 [Acanthoscelides obtectus]
MEDPESAEHEEEISGEDVNKILQKYLGGTEFVVIRKALKPLATPGMLGRHANLEITFLNSSGVKETQSFFVKFLPKITWQAEFAKAIGAFTKEIFVYELLERYQEVGITILTNVVPKFYLGKDNECLVLENLSEDGYKTLDKYPVLEYDSVLTILNALANFHAGTIVFEEKQGENLLEIYGENLRESFFDCSESFANKKGIEASIRGVLREIDIFEFPLKLNSGKNFKELAKEVCYKICELVKPSKKCKNVLTHGDTWSSNILIKKDESTNMEKVKFVDFQYCRYTPPSQDVLAFIYFTTSRSFRQKHLYEVLGVYYSYLEKYLTLSGVDPNKVLPFSEFMDSCEEQKVFAIVVTAIYFQIILIEDGVPEQYFDSADKDKLFMEDRGLIVEDYAKKDEKYKERLKDSIQDLKDYCERL